MDESNLKLDLEFKHYLQILRPYLVQLAEEDTIQICNAWIQRLSVCSEKEKPMRNKYIFVLCYQLAKGVLEDPFLKYPPNDDLTPISEIGDSDSSETECSVADEYDANTKVLYNSRHDSDTDNICNQVETSTLSNLISTKEVNSMNPILTAESSTATRKQTILCYTCPEVLRTCFEDMSTSSNQDHYENRANKLIMRLRQIKRQNELLHNELTALKEESREKSRESCVSLTKIDNATSTYSNANNTKTQYDERQKLKQNLNELQEQLDSFNESRKHEIEEIKAEHKLDILKIKASLREENKNMYEKKLDELKNHYEQLMTDIKKNNADGVQNVCTSKNEAILEKEKTIQEKTQEIEEKNKEIQQKNKELEEKDKTIKSRDVEIFNLKAHLDDQSMYLQSVINKFLDKTGSDSNIDHILKMKAQELEKRLYKMEKSKAKCCKAYEAKLAFMQREKHLAECSLQLQLVRQRAQVVNEISDESQVELAAALDKLESKYKDIVANVQTTAIQRRLQDEMAMNAILQAACACGLRNEPPTKYSQFSGKTVTIGQRKEESQSCDSEISGSNRREVQNGYKEESVAEGYCLNGYEGESVAGGYCLNGSRFGELLEKVYIPQRDNNNTTTPYR